MRLGLALLLSTALSAGMSPALAQEEGQPARDPAAQTAPPEQQGPTGEAIESGTPGQAEPQAPNAQQQPRAPQPQQQGQPMQNQGQAQQQQQVPTSREDAARGQTYIAGEYTDWTLRCIRIDETNDVCELHQSLSDSDGTRTAEINVFPLDQGQAAAGGTIVTPLETLLTENIRLSVDGGAARAYPFTFCNRVGCVSQIGLTQADLDGFRRGAAARLDIVPLAAPDQVVSLDVSLAGFTAGFDAMQETVAEAEAE